MNDVALFGLKRCSTCVKAMAWLEQQNIKYTFSDYRDQPIHAEQLSAWSDQLGGWEKLVNRASTTWRNLPDERKSVASEPEWLALIAEFPTLIKRPVLLGSDGSVSVGFSDKKYQSLLG